MVNGKNKGLQKWVTERVYLSYMNQCQKLHRIPPKIGVDWVFLTMVSSLIVSIGMFNDAWLYMLYMVTIITLN